MEKQYEVTYSYSLDFIVWDCPACGTHVEEGSYDSPVCPNCDFERDGQKTFGDTYDESESFDYEEESE